MPSGTPKKRIAFILDERLSRDRAKLLLSKIGSLRHDHELTTVRGDTPDPAILKELERKSYDLVMGPWYRYLNWKRIEGHFGLSRTQGPTVAGYTAEPTSVQDLPKVRPDLTRLTIFDFIHLSNGDVRRLVSALINEKRRTGILPLLEPNSAIYMDTWQSQVLLGQKSDQVLSVPEIQNHEWAKRTTDLRLLLIALWTMIYQEGPGKNDGLGSNSNVTRAHFQIGIDPSSIVLRLFFRSGSFKSKDSIAHFWPNQSKPLSGMSLLARFSDFVRILSISDSPQIELVTGLLKSAPARQAPGHLRNIWIEPVAEKLLLEKPTEKPGPNQPYLKLLPGTSSTPQSVGPYRFDQSKERDRLLVKANSQINDLKTEVSQRNDQIQELKRGGVGRPHVLPPPDTQALLDAIEERARENHHYQRQFEMELSLLLQRNASEQEMQPIQRKLEELEQRRKAWRKQVTEVLEHLDSAPRDPIGRKKAA